MVVMYVRFRELAFANGKRAKALLIEKAESRLVLLKIVCCFSMVVWLWFTGAYFHTIRPPNGNPSRIGQLTDDRALGRGL